MLYSTLEILASQLDAYLTNNTLSQSMVEVGNVAAIDDPPTNQGNSLDGKVILSLLHTEEEATLRNEVHYKKIASYTHYQNPPTFLNLYVLFSVNIAPYKESIRQLSRIIEFFQGKRMFNQQNTPISQNLSIGIEPGEEFKFTLDLFSLSLEASVNLWSNLNSKQLPSVIYKVRVTPIERKRVIEQRRVIFEHQLNNEKNYTP